MTTDARLIDIDLAWRPGESERLREFLVDLLDAERGQVRKVIRVLRRWREQQRTMRDCVFQSGSFVCGTTVKAQSAFDVDICACIALPPGGAAASGGLPPHLRSSRLSLSVFASFRCAWEVADLILAAWSRRIVGPGKPAKNLLPRLVDRCRGALLRLVGGFFGPYKVDARNNP